MRSKSILAAGALFAVLAAPAAAQQEQQQQAAAPPATADEAFQEMEEMLGSVPGFFREIPEQAVPGAWAEMKAVQLNPDTALEPKHKELIGLAVAAQVPCDYCVYFHTEAARQAGADDQEIQEALAMAAITRHWSTVLNGSQIELQAFRQQTDEIMAHVAEGAQAAEAPETQPSAEQEQEPQQQEQPSEQQQQQQQQQ